MRTFCIVAASALCLLAVSVRDAAAQSADAWARANDQVVRLAPSAFAALPAAVRRDLERRGCRVPQAFDAPKPHNVVRGAFVGRGSRDWAVLCSIRDSSRVLVYRGGAGVARDSLVLAPDVDYLQGIGGGRIGYSRAIYVASPRRIRDASGEAGERRPRVDHDGIEVSFVEKASTIFYLRGGQWFTLAGAD